MKTVRSLAIIMATALLGACTGYNSTDVDDRNDGNERVYGDIGGPARQLAREYPDDPEAMEKANMIRAMWWPEKGQEQIMDTVSLKDLMDEDEGDYEDVNIDTSATTIDTANNPQNNEGGEESVEGVKEDAGRSNKQVD